jgi:hypothetical protein
MNEVLALQKEFRETVIAWSLVRSDSTAANPLFERQHEIAKLLRSDQEGRDALEQLFDDDDVEVRAVAATASLFWGSQAGQDILSAIALRPDLIGFEADVTLKSYKSGTLNLDW